MAEKPFLTDVKTLRERARKHIQEGAVTPGYGADRDTVVKILNEALATELVCVLRYKRHFYMATGINAPAVAAEFLEHATDEQGGQSSCLETPPRYEWSASRLGLSRRNGRRSLVEKTR